jgi:hypothetical protein
MGRQGSETRTPFALALCPKNVGFLFYLHEFANKLLVGHIATAMTGFWKVDTFSDNTMLRFHCYKNEYGEQCKSCILKQGSVATLRDSITCVSMQCPKSCSSGVFVSCDSVTVRPLVQALNFSHQFEMYCYICLVKVLCFSHSHIKFWTSSLTKHLLHSVSHLESQIASTPHSWSSYMARHGKQN